MEDQVGFKNAVDIRCWYFFSCCKLDGVLYSLSVPIIMMHLLHRQLGMNAVMLTFGLGCFLLFTKLAEERESQ